MKKLNQKYINRIVKKALDEDLKPLGDITTNLINFQNKTKKTIEEVTFLTKLKNLKDLESETANHDLKVPIKKNKFKKKKFYKKKFFKKTKSSPSLVKKV